MLELIHSDLCEFEGILTRGGNKYIITFINDFSKYKTIYLLKTKSDTFEKFQDFFLKEIENQFGGKIKRIRKDEDVSMNQVHSTHLFSLCELSIKLLRHIHVLLMVWLKEKIKL